MTEEDIQFIDADQYMPQKDKMTFRELVFRHLMKISEICKCEFREGYWQKKPVSIGSGMYMSELYVEDKRDAYINAVDFLHDILLPHFDKPMTDASEKSDKTLEDTKKVYEQKQKKTTDWLDEKLKIKRKLFQQLSLLLQRLKYFESPVIKQ